MTSVQLHRELVCEKIILILSCAWSELQLELVRQNQIGISDSHRFRIKCVMSTSDSKGEFL